VAWQQQVLLLLQLLLLLLLAPAAWEAQQPMPDPLPCRLRHCQQALAHLQQQQLLLVLLLLLSLQPPCLVA
jgi:hypothetical protein